MINDRYAYAAIRNASAARALFREVPCRLCKMDIGKQCVSPAGMPTVVHVVRRNDTLRFARYLEVLWG